MPTRRLDDRIRELCAKVGAEARLPELDNVSTEALMQELLDAIHQKVERIRALAARKLLPPADPQEEQDEKDQKERRAG